MLGSLLIVVGVTAYSLRITRDLEGQNRLITEMFSDLASRLLFSGESQEAERVIGIINEIKIPLIITDNAGRPIFWNSGVTGIPDVDDYELIMRQDPQNPKDPRIARAVKLAAELDRHSEPFAIMGPDGRRQGPTNGAAARCAGWQRHCR